MASHFMRTISILLLLAFLGVVSIYLVDSCDIQKRTCSLAFDPDFDLPTIFSQIIERVK